MTEFCADGSIDSFLKNKNATNAVKKQWIAGIAAGMSHLATEGVVR